MNRPFTRPQILLLDSQRERFPQFHALLDIHAKVYPVSHIDGILAHPEFHHPATILLLDLADIGACEDTKVETLLQHAGRERVGLLAANETGDYLATLRRWGIHRVLVKEPPVDEEEAALFLRCLKDAEFGFGLGACLARTIEMYRFTVSSREEKLGVAERVINYFATAGYQVHDLYDVRLVLEEALNNAIFHGFRTGTGEEKYHPDTFTELDRREKILIEYGSNGPTVGFTVTDNAGTLRPETILDRLQKQQDPTGIYQLSGRGLHLSRMLSSLFVVNIDAGNHTQVIALFDERRRMNRVKPFLINTIQRQPITPRSSSAP